MNSKKEADVDQLVENVLSSYEAGPRSMHHIGAYELPQQSEVQACVETVRACALVSVGRMTVTSLRKPPAAAMTPVATRAPTEPAQRAIAHV